MFIGEASAFILLALIRLKETQSGYTPINEAGQPALPLAKTFVLSLPAICDILGTTLMMVGLSYTPVSIYQMTRGSLIIFVALFSIIFLKHTISRIEWSALFTVILGITIVGLSANSNSGASEDSTTEPVLNPRLLLGIVMILLAQIFTATQFVVEEHIVKKWTVEPLSLVGWEGVFGGGITFIGMSLLYILIGRNTKGPFDMKNAFDEMVSDEKIVSSSFAIMISICLFNFLGITLTSKLSATARSTIDTCRTLLVWVVSIYLGWESFVALQFVGFVILVFGTLVFNGALKVDSYLPAWFSADKNKPLIINSIDEQIERV